MLLMFPFYLVWFSIMEHIWKGHESWPKSVAVAEVLKSLDIRAWNSSQLASMSWAKESILDFPKSWSASCQRIFRVLLCKPPPIKVELGFSAWISSIFLHIASSFSLANISWAKRSPKKMTMEQWRTSWMALLVCEVWEGVLADKGLLEGIKSSAEVQWEAGRNLLL